jgi:F-type H+-transporting ATPase subunit b
MNKACKAKCLTCCISAALVLVIWLAPGALAADQTGGWRPTYDLVMRWLNFVILALVLIKFARRPLIDFLTGKKKEIARDIQRMEKEKEKAALKVAEVHKKLADSSIRFEELKERIIRQGEKRKRAIIAEAHRESEILLEGAKRKIDSQVLQAENTLRSEMIDMAVNAAIERLPGQLTENDNQKLLDQFLKSTAS